MGKGFENYMSKKWFHPTNIDNLKRKYAAEQKAAGEKQRQQDLRDQYEREQEIFSNKQLMGDEKARLGLSFIYNAPGSLKDQDKDKQQNETTSVDATSENKPTSASRQNKNVRCLKCKKWGHSNIDKSCPMYGRSKLDTDGDVAESSDHDTDENDDKIKANSNIKTEPVERDFVGVSSGGTPASDDDHVTLDLLKSFSKKEKKLLIKRLIHLERKVSSK